MDLFKLIEAGKESIIEEPETRKIMGDEEFELQVKKFGRKNIKWIQDDKEIIFDMEVLF